MNAAFHTLIEAAIRAPSGDNTQPWRFAIDEEAQTISVGVDPTCDQSPMNAGQRMARIAVGAAVENILVAAEHNRRVADVDCQLNSDSAVLIQCAGLDDQSGEVPALLAGRVTNRRAYDGRTVAPAEIAHLDRAIPPSIGVRPIWLTDRSKLNAVATLVGQADALMFGVAAVRKAFLENIRFDRPPREQVEEGLSLGSLELGFGERFGLRLLSSIPDRVFRSLGMAGTFRNKATNLVRSGSGLCVLVADNDDPKTDFAVGRLMQQAWLRLGASGFAVQPMMSLPVLDNLLASGQGQAGKLPFSEADSLIGIFQSSLNIENSVRIAAILRFGRASHPTSRTGRRPAALVTCNVAAAGLR